ncbi:SirQ [Niveomyces insectorum RCEF 264]|uniref:SirQ n=1 Tax=Niveomyces insectorum RCEF 264 TaxID=1081102 RepID=A0A167VLA3_9HYPO|nr:SirQ [Niveomyces insectorum RCEF 264]
MAPNHALVYGASGITGWAIVNAILEGYPTPETFGKVTALTNRPLTAEAALWPASPKLQIVSGIDLLTDKGQAGLEAEMQARVPDIETVTHVYFFAYIMDPDPKKEVDINVELIRRAVTAVENLAPTTLTFVVLPTGTKAYGVHLLRDNFPFHKDLPLRETLPRIPEPYASQMFYYGQTDMLSAMSKGKRWTWCEIIPDVIIGFVPNNNVYCLAQQLGTYLSLYRELHGEGAEVVFPGTTASWTNLFIESSQDMCAKVSIVASLQPATTSEQRYNAADNNRPASWSEKWPVVAAYFGLKGVAPPAAGGAGPDPVIYLADHFAEWQALEKKHGLQTGRVGNERNYGGFVQFIMSMFDFDRQMDMTKCFAMMGKHKVEYTTQETFYTAFDRFRKAKIIP